MKDAKPIQVRRLLVGVDERPQAEHAIRAGVHLAHALGAQLDLVHALHLPQPMRGVGGIARWVETTSKIQDTAREHLVARVQRVLAVEAPEGVGGRGAEEMLDVVPGKPAAVLTHEVSERGADLFVLGTHSRHRGLDFGNTARSLLAASEVPVWVQPTAWTPVERLLVPIDLDSGGEVVLRWARLLAESLSVPVQVLHTYDPPSFAYDVDLPPEVMPHYVVDDLRKEDEEQFAATFRGFDWGPVDAVSSWVEGRPAETVLGRARAGDLVVMGTHGRGGFLGAVLGSEAWAVLRGAQTPVLVVPLRSRAADD